MVTNTTAAAAHPTRSNEGELHELNYLLRFVSFDI